MGSLERRLRSLERHAARRTAADSREILRRMSDPELEAYEAALVRSEAGEEPTEADRAIAGRVRAIREEMGI